MILKRYGSTYQSVDLNFDSKSLNEIGFRRNRQHEIPVDDFDTGWTRGDVHEVTATAEGTVQDATEQVLLDKLSEQIRALEAELGPQDALLFENGDGPDYPKTKQATRNVAERGENRLHFQYTIAPPIRMVAYRRND